MHECSLLSWNVMGSDGGWTGFSRLYPNELPSAMVQMDSWDFNRQGSEHVFTASAMLSLRQPH